MNEMFHSLIDYGPPYWTLRNSPFLLLQKVFLLQDHNEFTVITMLEDSSDLASRSIWDIQ